MGYVKVTIFEVLAIVWCGFLLATAVTWLSFSRINFRNMSRRVVGDRPEEAVDILGLRVLAVATVIAVPEWWVKRLENGPYVNMIKYRSVANTSDRRMALLLIVSSYGFAFTAFVGYFFIPSR